MRKNGIEARDAGRDVIVQCRRNRLTSYVLTNHSVKRKGIAGNNLNVKTLR